MNFTFAHALTISLALHGALALPFVLPPPEPPEDAPILVVELQGVEAPTQSEQKVQQQTKGEGNPQEAQAPTPPTPPPTEAKQQVAAPEEPPEPPVENGERAAAPPPQPEQKQQEAPAPQPTAAQAQSGAAGAANVEGTTEQQQAQTVAPDPLEEAELLRLYVKALTKKVQENLVYPDSGRKAGLKGTARVGFTLLADGSIGPGTLHVTESSGQPQLDASAVKTVEASAPFGPPPHAITIAIAVIYGKVAASAKK